MKQIEIKRRNGDTYIIKLDDADYEWAKQYRWRYIGSGYAARYGDKGTDIMMHREVLERHGVEVARGMSIDHVNRDTFDNRLVNLRVCTHAENLRNRASTKNSLSRYKGVSWLKRISSWSAHIQVDGKDHYLGVSPSDVVCAYWYNEAAKQYHGDFAVLNPIPPELEAVAKLYPRRTGKRVDHELKNELLRQLKAIEAALDTQQAAADDSIKERMMDDEYEMDEYAAQDRQDRDRIYDAIASDPVLAEFVRTFDADANRGFMWGLRLSDNPVAQQVVRTVDDLRLGLSGSAFGFFLRQVQSRLQAEHTPTPPPSDERSA